MWFDDFYDVDLVCGSLRRTDCGGDYQLVVSCHSHCSGGPVGPRGSWLQFRWIFCSTHLRLTSWTLEDQGLLVDRSTGLAAYIVAATYFVALFMVYPDGPWTTWAGWVIGLYVGIIGPLMSGAGSRKWPEPHLTYHCSHSPFDMCMVTHKKSCFVWSV